MLTELLLGIAGTVIALAVAVTTIWQGFLARQYNRLSVKPMLRVDRITVSGENAKIVLRNTGVGPAVIIRIKFFVDGVAIEQSFSKVGELALQKIGLDTAHYRILEIFPKESFSAGEQPALFESIDIIKDYMMAEEVRKAFKRLAVEVEYESIYKEKFNCMEKSDQKDE